MKKGLSWKDITAWIALLVLLKVDLEIHKDTFGEPIIEKVKHSTSEQKETTPTTTITNKPAKKYSYWSQTIDDIFEGDNESDKYLNELVEEEIMDIQLLKKIIEANNQQLEDVRKQYESTDKWLKAPNGKPLIVYHSMPEYGFSEFIIDEVGKYRRPGAWFTSERDNAYTYANDDEKK